MTQRELQIHYRTRDRRFLLRGALGIGMILGLIGLTAGLWRGAAIGLRIIPQDGAGFLVQEIIGDGPGLGGRAETIRKLSAHGEQSLDERRRQVEALILADLPAAEASRLKLLADGLLGDVAAQTQAVEALRKAATSTPLRRFDHEWLADVLCRRQEFDEASAGYETEGRAFPDAGRARNRAFELALNREDAGKLRQLLADPAMTLDVPASQQARGQALCGNYASLFTATLREQMSRFSSWFHTVISVLCGTLWWMIFARIAGVPARHWWLALPALLLGVFATTLVLVGQIVAPITFNQNGDFLDRALFFTIGVGLREETFKLLCTLPLIIFLRREQSANVVLIVLSAVGLGFAVSENTIYLGTEPSRAWGRFLTANFLHLAWTGMLGSSLWRACRGAAHGWEQFLATFLLVVLSHGAYDLCSGSVMGESLGLFSILIFVAVAFRYLIQLRSVAETSSQVVSPLAVFIFGSAAVLGLTFAGLCWGLGVRWGTVMCLSEALCMAPMAFLFIREFRDD
jgi:RsiW-degrading membrane proteinase PrsW (M82 family)